PGSKQSRGASRAGEQAEPPRLGGLPSAYDDHLAASAVGRCVRIVVVTILASLLLHDAIAAVGAQGAIHVASVVTADVVLFTFVTLLTCGENAVSADRCALAASRLEPRQGQL